MEEKKTLIDRCKDVKDFVKKHEEKFVAAGIAVVAGAAGVKLGRKIGFYQGVGAVDCILAGDPELYDKAAECVHNACNVMIGKN